MIPSSSFGSNLGMRVLVGAVSVALAIGFGLSVWSSLQAERLADRVAATEDALEPLLTVESNSYATVGTADRARGIHLDGANCWADSVETAVVQVSIKWSWVNTGGLPPGVPTFYTEDAAATRYGTSRVPLDADNCLDWSSSDFVQQFPEALLRDLQRHEELAGDMVILFTLVPTDVTDPDRHMTQPPVFVDAGPFTIPPHDHTAGAQHADSEAHQ